MPDWRSVVRARLADHGLAPDAGAALVDELAQHVEDAYRSQRAQGASDEDALAAALRELDGCDRLAVEIEARRHDRVPPLSPVPSASTSLAGLWQDCRYAARVLRRSPAFTVAAVLTVALSTGPTMAALGVANWLFVQPVPGVHEPDRLGLVRFATWSGQAAFRHRACRTRISGRWRGGSQRSPR
jgi:hypothetical protein